MINPSTEPALLDALVQRLRHDPRPLPDAALLSRYEAAVDGAYRLRPGVERRQALDRENGRLVAHLGLARRVMQVAAEHREIVTRLTRVVLAAARRGEQRVDVHGPGPDGALALVVRLEVDVWLDAAATERVLRHELLHAADMLDPAFAYDAAAAWPGATHGQRERARARFTAMWCLTVDARLARDGREPVAAPGAYEDELALVFGGGLEDARALVAELSATRRFTHAELLARAAAGAGSEAGAPCPLCGFPSSDWAPASSLPEAATRAIQADFPAWRPADGCCARCLECYESQGRVR